MMNNRTLGGTLPYVDEQRVREALQPRDLLRVACDLLETADPNWGASLEVGSGLLTLGAKAGFADADCFGLKIRCGREGHYITLAWTEPGLPAVVVEAQYLTYFRTAAVAMALPLRH